MYVMSKSKMRKLNIVSSVQTNLTFWILRNSKSFPQLELCSTFYSLFYFWVIHLICFFNNLTLFFPSSDWLIHLISKFNHLSVWNYIKRCPKCWLCVLQVSGKWNFPIILACKAWLLSVGGDTLPEGAVGCKVWAGQTCGQSVYCKQIVEQTTANTLMADPLSAVDLTAPLSESTAHGQPWINIPSTGILCVCVRKYHV